MREGAEPMNMSIAALKTQPFYKRLPHDRVAAMWQAAFPDARFELRLFDSRDFVGGDLMTDFKAAAGLEVDLPTATHRNVSNLSNAGVNAMIYLNRRNRAAGKIVVGASQHRLETFLAQHMPGRCSMLTRPERAAIDETFAASNERLRARFFPARETLFRPAAEDADREDFHRIEDPAFFAQIDELIADAFEQPGT